jgi:DNA repair exonuclease SbcCD ATPase subunit
MSSAEYPNDPDSLLDLEEDVQEDLGEEVQKTNTELEKLRRQLEDIEKQKVKLEELKRRQDELEIGRAEMTDKLTRSLVVVHRETEEAQKRLETLNAIHNSFTQHLRFIEGVNPKLWGASELPKELSKALSAVEEARSDFSKAQPKISIEEPAESLSGGAYDAEYGYAEDRGFSYWLMNGIAFTLPLSVLGLLALMVWVLTLLSAN